jgi:hypothetical protein
VKKEEREVRKGDGFFFAVPVSFLDLLVSWGGRFLHYAK